MAKKSSPNTALKLNERDMAILDALVEREQLSKSDTVRRAIRHYARALGVSTDPEPTPATATP